MKTRFSVYDPMVQQALAASGSSYVVPSAAQPLPLSPQEQAIGQALQEQAELDDVRAAMSGYEHQVGAPPVAPPEPVVRPLGGISMDWQPPVQTPPAAAMVSPAAEPAFEAQQQRRQGRSQLPSENKMMRDMAFENIAGTYDERQDAARQAAGARSAAEGERSRLLDRSGVDRMMADQELADAADDNESAVAKVQAKQAEDAEFVRTFEPRDRRTTGQRAMSAIAIGLSGLGDALMVRNGGQSGGHLERAVAMVNRSIDRDMDQQQKMLDNRRTAMAARNTELGQMRERYGDQRDAVKMAYAMKIDQYQRELESVAAAGNSAAQAAIARDSVAQLEEQKQRLFADVYGAEYQRELKARQGMSLEKRLSIEGKMLANEKSRRELDGSAGGGAQDVAGYKRTKDVAPAQVTEANKTASASASLNSSLDQLARLRDEYDRTGVSEVGKRESIAKRAKQLIGNYADTSSQLAGGGQAGEAAKKQALEDIPDPTQWSLPGRADPRAVYSGLKLQNTQTANARLKSLGYEATGEAAAAEARARVQRGAVR